jgi:hypothetical protein
MKRPEDLRDIDADITTNVRTTIRELKPGEYYIPIRLLTRYGMRGLIRSVRKRTEDPFLSETVLGSTVKSYPSDKVHPVKLIPSPRLEN